MLGAVWVLSVHQTTKPQIIVGRVSGKFFEIPNKMRLIIVAELVRDQSPIDGLDGVNAVQNVSKAEKAR